MARAKRHYIPGYVWHSPVKQSKKRFNGVNNPSGYAFGYDPTGRCHKREFLLKWTQSIAVGSKTFIEKMKKALGYRAKGRKIRGADDTFELREAVAPFGNADNLDSGNTYFWNQQPPSLIGQFLHEN